MRRVALVMVMLLLCALVPAAASASHRGGTPRVLDYQVVIKNGDNERVCWNAWVEDRDGTYFIPARYFSQCAGLYYNWNTRARVMQITRHRDEVTDYQLEAWPVERDGRDTFTWRENYSSEWKTFNLGNDHPYESVRGTANMIPVYLYTAAFDMFYAYNDAEHTVTISLDQPALPKQYDAARAAQSLVWNPSGTRMDLATPDSGVWNITPAAWRHAREFGLSAPRMMQRLYNAGANATMDTSNLRIRVAYPGISHRPLMDLYPSSQYTVLWFNNKQEANTWISEMKLIAGGTTGIGGVPGAASGITGVVAGSVAWGVGGSLVAVGSAIYGADRLFAITDAEACRDASGDSMGFVVDSQSAAFAHVTGCVTSYTDRPVNPGGLHY